MRRYIKNLLNNRKKLLNYTKKFSDKTNNFYEDKKFLKKFIIF